MRSSDREPGLLKVARPGWVGALEVGAPLGLVLGGGVLGLSSSARAAVGPGPPWAPTLAMHVVFGLVVAAAVAFAVPRRGCS